MNINFIKREKSIYIFGAKNREFIYRFFNSIGVEVKAYVDNNSDLWGKEIIAGAACISPDEMDRDTMCVITVGSKNVKSVIEQLDTIGNRYVVFNEFNGDDCYEYLKRNLFSFELSSNIKYVGSQFWKKKVAIYTVISRGYDKLKAHDYYMEDADYFYISDCEVKECPERYQWIDLNNIVPETGMDSVRKARYCKTHPHMIFSEYDYSIYLDGSMVVKSDIQFYFRELGSKSIATYEHPERNCIYEEGVACVWAGLDDRTVIKNQLEEYHQQGMPQHFGLFETGVLVRRHNDEKCIQIMEDWWHEILGKSFRDQLSLTYVLWKNGMKYEDISVLGRNFYDSREIAIHGHNK